MPMVVGSCVVDANGNITGSGLALDIANAWKAAMTAGGSLPVPLQKLLTPFATTFAVQLATAIINQITNNAGVTVTIHTTDVGLQTTPNPNNPATATAGPVANKTLVGTIT